MYPFPPSTWIASRATAVAVSAEKRIAAAHSRARSPFEPQPPETERAEPSLSFELPSFFASALAAAAYTSALAACVLVQPSASLAATSWKSPMRVPNCLRCEA